MTDEELNGIARGVYIHLQKMTESPVNAVGILGTALLILFEENCTDNDVEKFAEDVKKMMIQTYFTVHGRQH